MKSIIIASLIFLVASVATAAEDKPPSFPATILDSQFPNFKGDTNSLCDLRRYRQQLEHFRQKSLEGYNRALQKFLLNLKKHDERLELNYANSLIGNEIYEKNHEYIVNEISKASGTGEYMQIYYDYAGKLKTEHDWLMPEITAREKDKIKF